MSTLFSDAPVDVSLADLVHDFESAMTSAYRRMLLPPWFTRVFGGRQYERVCARLRHNLGRIVQDYRARGVDRGDLLSILVAANECPADGGSRQVLTDTQIIDHIMTFFVGGMETCGSLLAWTLHLLALHPEVERELHAEVDAVLGGQPVCFEHIPALEVTQRIVTEVLRLYPAAWIATRVTKTDTHLGGHALEAGSTVVLCPYLLQHKPDLFPDPERFDPDRWKGKSTRRPKDDPLFAWAGGARRCIGEGFAMTATMLALASIAASWRLATTPGSKVRPAVSAVIAPHGLRMEVLERKRRASSVAIA